MGTLGTATKLSKIEGSNGKIISYSIVPSASYATGGDTFDASADFAIVDNIVGGIDGGRYSVLFDRATAGAPATCKVLMYDAAAADGGDELANATDLSASTLLLSVFGR